MDLVIKGILIMGRRISKERLEVLVRILRSFNLIGYKESAKISQKFNKKLMKKLIIFKK